MRYVIRAMLVLPLLAASLAWADDYADTIKIFKNAGQSSTFFQNAYGYAVFPTIAKAGVGVGFARGQGRVYVGDKYVGDSTMTQATVGRQIGGQAFSQIIFFEDKRAFTDFTAGSVEFGAQATAVGITAGASASAGTTGSAASASGNQNAAATAGAYRKGMAIFTVAKGGLMYEASIGGQKFSYKPH